MSRLPIENFWRRRLLMVAAASLICHPSQGRASNPVSPPITALAVSPDDRVVAGSQNGLTVRDARSLEILERIPAGMDQVHDLMFSPDGRFLAVVGGNPGESGQLLLLDWQTKNRHKTGSYGDDVCYSFDFAPNADRWVVACGDRTAIVASIGAKQADLKFEQHSRPVLACCFLPDGTTVVTAGRDQTLRVWDASSGQTIRTMHNHTDDVRRLRLRPSSEGLPMVASASADRTVRFWQPTIGRMVRFARLPAKPLDIVWINEGGLLLAACDDGKAYLIDPDTVKIEKTFDAVGSWAYTIAADPKRQRVYIGGPDGEIVSVDTAR